MIDPESALFVKARCGGATPLTEEEERDEDDAEEGERVEDEGDGSAESDEYMEELVKGRGTDPKTLRPCWSSWFHCIGSWSSRVVISFESLETT